MSCPSASEGGGVSNDMTLAAYKAKLQSDAIPSHRGACD